MQVVQFVFRQWQFVCICSAGCFRFGLSHQLQSIQRQFDVFNSSQIQFHCFKRKTAAGLTFKRFREQKSIKPDKKTHQKPEATGPKPVYVCCCVDAFEHADETAPSGIAQDYNVNDSLPGDKQRLVTVTMILQLQSQLVLLWEVCKSKNAM